MEDPFVALRSLKATKEAADLIRESNLLTLASIRNQRDDPNLFVADVIELTGRDVSVRAQHDLQMLWKYASGSRKDNLKIEASIPLMMDGPLPPASAKLAESSAKPEV